MCKNTKINLSRCVIFVLALLTSTVGAAWQGQGGEGGHYHGGGGYYNHGGGSYYRGGGYYGNGWGGPNIVIGVPLGGYYGPTYVVPAPVCETVRICNQYNRCWFEEECR